MKGLSQTAVVVFFALAITAGMVSCGEKKPDDILSRQEMVEILEELYVAEEKVNHLGLARDSAKAVAAAMLARVFEQADVGDSLYKKSFDYYMEHPREMELIYTALVDTLQLKEQRAPDLFHHQ